MTKKVASALFVLVLSAHLLGVVPAAHAHAHEIEGSHLEQLHD